MEFVLLVAKELFGESFFLLTAGIAKLHLQHPNSTALAADDLSQPYLHLEHHPLSQATCTSNTRLLPPTQVQQHHKGREAGMNPERAAEICSWLKHSRHPGEMGPVVPEVWEGKREFTP